MTLYTRHQLLLLLILLAAAGLGLAVGYWRRADPDVVDYVEQLDRAPAPATGVATQPRERRRRPAPTLAPSSPPLRRATRRAESPAHAGQADAAPMDLNHARVSDLTRLPGIGRVLAQRIVDTRETEGSFASVDELRRVRGLSAGKVEKFRALVTVAD